MAAENNVMQFILENLLEASQQQVRRDNYLHELFNAFLEHMNSGVDPTAVTERGWNIVHIAVYLGQNYIKYISKIKKLSDAKEDVEPKIWDKLIQAKTSSSKTTPIEMAVAHNNPAIIEFFIKSAKKTIEQVDILLWHSPKKLLAQLSTSHSNQSDPTLQEKNKQIKSLIEDMRESQNEKTKSDHLHACVAKMIQYINDGADPTVVSDSGWNILHAVLNNHMALSNQLPALITAIDNRNDATDMWYIMLNHKSKSGLMPRKMLYSSRERVECKELQTFITKARKVLTDKEKVTASQSRNNPLAANASNNSSAYFSAAANKGAMGGQAPLQGAQASSSSGEKRTSQVAGLDARVSSIRDKTRRIG